MDWLESPSIRWAIAFLFLAVELLLFIGIADLFWVDQLVVLVTTVFLFALLPSILQSVSETGTAPIESTQQQRAAFVAGVVDTVAATLRLDRIAPVISWIAAAFLVILAGGTLRARPGMSIRVVFSASIYVLLAAFAAPSVRRYLQEELQLDFSWLVVVTILVTGVLVNEAVFTPPVEQPAVIAASFSLLL
jgi:hypothetical protein